MKSLIFITALTCVLSSISSEAATTKQDVFKFDQATRIGATAVRNKNYDKAYKHLEEASKLGDKVSQYTLALLYMEGLGVEQDYGKAYLWLNVASEAKEKKWRNARDQIKNAMSKEQRAAFQPLVDEYIEKYGAFTQGVICFKQTVEASKRKVMKCSKEIKSGR
ncbi:MAG: hypothetical protein ABJK64_13875 [Paraglaciecola sp.]|uniref:tetratricopeptide repeat protein n=1 Tax=Paraglaciecola sp. TaxID=1920173 RepID=UPI003299BE91